MDTVHLEQMLALAIAHLEMGFPRAEFDSGDFHIVAMLSGSAQVVVLAKGVPQGHQLMVTIPGQPGPRSSI